MSRQFNQEPLGSLNVIYRKKEGENIEIENIALAKRLLEKKPAFNSKILEDDFERHLKYKTLVMRMTGR